MLPTLVTEQAGWTFLASPVRIGLQGPTPGGCIVEWGFDDRLNFAGAWAIAATAEDGVAVATLDADTYWNRFDASPCRDVYRALVDQLNESMTTVAPTVEEAAGQGIHADTVGRFLANAHTTRAVLHVP